MPGIVLRNGKVQTDVGTRHKSRTQSSNSPKEGVSEEQVI